MNKIINSNEKQSARHKLLDNFWICPDKFFLMFVTPYQNIRCYNTEYEYDIFKFQRSKNLKPENSKCNRSKNLVAMTNDNDDDMENPRFFLYRRGYEHVFTPSKCSQEIF
jgi:hypothetical protein